MEVTADLKDDVRILFSEWLYKLGMGREKVGLGHKFLLLESVCFYYFVEIFVMLFLSNRKVFFK